MGAHRCSLSHIPFVQEGRRRRHGRDMRRIIRGADKTRERVLKVGATIMSFVLALIWSTVREGWVRHMM